MELLQKIISYNRVFSPSQPLFLCDCCVQVIKYARPGVAPEISICLEKDGGKKHLIVTDNGSGFDLDKVKGKVFGLNQTFHQNRDSKGVGLYLVHEHVTCFGEEITLESKVNEGSRFTITFKEQCDDLS